jgi:hypothetical protein
MSFQRVNINVHVQNVLAARPCCRNHDQACEKKLGEKLAIQYRVRVSTWCFVTAVTPHSLHSLSNFLPRLLLKFHPQGSQGHLQRRQKQQIACISFRTRANHKKVIVCVGFWQSHRRPRTLFPLCSVEILCDPARANLCSRMHVITRGIDVKMISHLSMSSSGTKRLTFSNCYFLFNWPYSIHVRLGRPQVGQ